MDIIIELAEQYGFQRTKSKLVKPLVFHCVPGAGKSTFIRLLLAEIPGSKAFTHGVADTPTICGLYIRDAKDIELTSSGSALLLDEYTEFEELPTHTLAAFGDPLQSNKYAPREPHFISDLTRRFGNQTVLLLKSLGFNVRTEKVDTVVVEDIYAGEPEGQILCNEREVAALLCAHQLDYLFVDQLRGRTFDKVTYITAENSPSDRVGSFQCLTRHTTKLKILCPDATYGPAELF
ncbi:triple gene block protein 1 [Elderberry carlavirus E]|uniref:Triple gene block protein 1 n=1 Tax=Elderberry carlavirus E TaxID=1569056 RepID=A0A0A7M8V2_9VIRU|nr:triple gene block protein 1 [Elderberry carlavirus E]AIZ76638.2 triple gene block protein 1 [Elderberry carlavirus E]